MSFTDTHLFTLMYVDPLRLFGQCGSLVSELPIPIFARTDNKGLHHYIQMYIEDSDLVIIFSLNVTSQGF